MKLVKVTYTLEDLQYRFEHAAEVLGPELFQLWVENFWSNFERFRRQGGKL